MSDNSEFTPHPLNASGEVLLGCGGTADCYKRIIGNRAYCIKRPKAAWRQSEDYMNLFQKEFTLGIELEHPNIVRYFDYGEDERGPFIKMDYVDGESLDVFAAKHPDFFDSKKNRRQLLGELLDAMAYLHGKRMLHLDLKPGNILITNKSNHVKLIDLGFAWTEGFLHDAGFSRDYCAPEQLRQQTDLLGAATDIYALGKIMQQFRMAKESIIKRCLKEDPKERFQSIEALRSSLRPKRWPLLVLATLFVGLLCRTLSTSIPLFISEPKSELTLEDSLALFKEELQIALAPTFYQWYEELNLSLAACSHQFSWSDEKGAMIPTRFVILEALDDKKDKLLAICRGIVKEKTKVLHLSATAKPQYEKVAQEVIDYYLQDYWKLKKQLENERDAYK